MIEHASDGARLMKRRNEKQEWFSPRNKENIVSMILWKHHVNFCGVSTKENIISIILWKHRVNLCGVFTKLFQHL